jgi:hypothetical protein
MSAFVSFETHGGGSVWIRRDAVVAVRKALPTEVADDPATKITLANGVTQFVIGEPGFVLFTLEPNETA